jgi:hypothetical protein
VAATESGIAEATRSLTIRALVKGAENGLVPGGFAKVKLSFAPDSSALLIPTQAIIPQARGKKVYLYRGGKVDFVSVETGIRDSSNIQITTGLKQGVVHTSNTSESFKKFGFSKFNCSNHLRTTKPAPVATSLQQTRCLHSGLEK